MFKINNKIVFKNLKVDVFFSMTIFGPDSNISIPDCTGPVLHQNLLCFLPVTDSPAPKKTSHTNSRSAVGDWTFRELDGIRGVWQEVTNH